ncbi:unnamed protein product [marine sediment metagenome]|uniref:Uncharacterized protein n=1 Tax=marine sediment metagenome TaxID=412755 RepID=X1EC37_9ZZZZ
MNVFEEKVFLGQTVRLDYSRWVNCVFKECEIIAVTGDFELIGCDFQNCKLILEGEAQTVARLMYIFYPDKIPLIFHEGDPGPLAKS